MADSHAPTWGNLWAIRTITGRDNLAELAIQRNEVNDDWITIDPSKLAMFIDTKPVKEFADVVKFQITTAHVHVELWPDRLELFTAFDNHPDGGL